MSLTARELGEFPGDWFILHQGKAGQGTEPLTFCSARCLSDWAEKQIAAKQYEEKLLLEQQLIAMDERRIVPDASEQTHWNNW